MAKETGVLGVPSYVCVCVFPVRLTSVCPAKTTRRMTRIYSVRAKFEPQRTTVRPSPPPQNEEVNLPVEYRDLDPGCLRRIVDLNLSSFRIDFCSIWTDPSLNI